VVSNTFIEFGA